jgi:uncharacterized protein YdeI (YjbR/CyaY-like superfamily)
MTSPSAVAPIEHKVKSMSGPTFEHRNGMEIGTFADAAQWEAWLAAHSAQRREIWLRIARRDSGYTTVTADQALDVCLCYGWIDSLRRRDEGGYFLQRYSPRRPGSPWSKINAAKVEALIAAGRMQPAGLAEVAAAKASGRWPADLS